MAFYYATAGRQEADVLIVGMPFDRTSSFTSGSRFGPDMARIGADNIESFSPYQQRDIAEVAVCDAGNLAFEFPDPSAPLRLIEQTVRRCISEGKRLLAVGGEHTVTPPIVRELARAHRDLCVIQFDAHSDLREDFQGERDCHATAMRRVLDVVPRDRLFQLGIRSFSAAGEMSATNLHPFAVQAPIPEVCAAIGGRPVYVTLDLDVMDPAFMPDVQTPQPGGCSYVELARALAGLAQMNVVGADIVEFCPRGQQPSAGASVAAELVREMLLLLSRTDGTRRSAGGGP
jgi:agmatinase